MGSIWEGLDGLPGEGSACMADFSDAVVTLLVGRRLISFCSNILFWCFLFCDASFLLSLLGFSSFIYPFQVTILQSFILDCLSLCIGKVMFH